MLQILYRKKKMEKKLSEHLKCESCSTYVLLKLRSICEIFLTNDVFIFFNVACISGLRNCRIISLIHERWCYIWIYFKLDDFSRSLNNLERREQEYLCKNHEDMLENSFPKTMAIRSIASMPIVRNLKWIRNLVE